jgi:hypothetical protein
VEMVLHVYAQEHFFFVMVLSHSSVARVRLVSGVCAKHHSKADDILSHSSVAIIRLASVVCACGVKDRVCASGKDCH